MSQNIEVTSILVLMDIMVQKYHKIVCKLVLRVITIKKYIIITHNMSSEGLAIHSNLIEMDINTKDVL